MIPAWLAPLATLVNKLIELIERAIYAKKQKDRQAKADQAHVDPAGSLADHFHGRVRNLPEDAGEADKAPD